MIKIILVATDFSPCANNAIAYAVELAKHSHAKLVLFHAFHIPVITADMPMEVPPFDQLRDDCMSSLRKIKEQIADTGFTAVECACSLGFAVDEIDALMKQDGIDLAVVGMQGAGFLTEKLLGNVASSLISKTKFPVLLIGERVKFRPIRKFVLASDASGIRYESVLLPLKDLAGIFNALVCVLNISEPHPLTADKGPAPGLLSIEQCLGDMDFTVHRRQNDDVVDGINRFVDKHAIEMVVMIPRRHTLLRRIFYESNTKRMAFHANTPLLVLHE